MHLMNIWSYNIIITFSLMFLSIQTFFKFFKFNKFRLRFWKTFQFIFTIISTFKSVHFTSQANKLIYPNIFRSFICKFTNYFFVFLLLNSSWFLSKLLKSNISSKFFKSLIKSFVFTLNTKLSVFWTISGKPQLKSCVSVSIS